MVRQSGMTVMEIWTTTIPQHVDSRKGYGKSKSATGKDVYSAKWKHRTVMNP